MEETLIAYYSRKGNNYVAGKIINLSIGNTAIVANKIKELTAGAMFEISTLKPYPDDYNQTVDISRSELRNNARPELSEIVNNMGSYKIIFLGYPNWWGTMPMAVFTFLETYNFSGKTIVPFCTHEGSAIGRSEKDIRKTCPDSLVLSGLAIRGSVVSNAENEIKNWLTTHKLI